MISGSTNKMRERQVFAAIYADVGILFHPYFQRTGVENYIHTVYTRGTTVATSSAAV